MEKPSDHLGSVTESVSHWGVGVSHAGSKAGVGNVCSFTHKRKNRKVMALDSGYFLQLLDIPPEATTHGSLRRETQNPRTRVALTLHAM